MPSLIPTETSNDGMKYSKSFPGSWLVQICILPFPQTFICGVFPCGSWSTGQRYVIIHSSFSVPPYKTGASLPKRVFKNTLLKISDKQKNIEYIMFP